MDDALYRLQQQLEYEDAQLEAQAARAERDALAKQLAEVQRMVAAEVRAELKRQEDVLYFRRSARSRPRKTG